MKVPTTWQAALPHEGDTHSLLKWWEGFRDPVLSRLLQAAEADSPTLAQATAAIKAARANRTEAGASSLPTVSAGVSASRSGSLKTGGGNSAIRTAGLDASWEIDLFGAVRRSTEAASARVDARAADWHAARVSLAAEVASEYVSFRACELLVANDLENDASLQKTARSTAVAVKNGLTAPADQILVSASVASAAAARNNQEVECEVGIKALVALTGMAEPALRESLAGSPRTIPTPQSLNINSLPVQLLSQRPDLVSAERTLAAASADIGVAEANRYPRLSLLGSVSVGSTQTAGTTVQTSPWSFGPSLTLPIFNGGSLRAKVAGAQASYASALAQYQSAVRTAVKETEQQLIRLDFARGRSKDLAASARDYRRYFDSAYRNWQSGGISLLTLEEARRNALQAEQGTIAVERDRVLYGIALYKALGGGWQQ